MGWDERCYARSMVASTTDRVAALEPERRVVLEGIDWEKYEAIVRARGDSAGERLFYLDGMLEIMSPSGDHETVKKVIARLVEAYAEEIDLDLRGFGSTTFRKRAKHRGAEPDECYVLGERPFHPGSIVDRPDLAIEVALSNDGLDKLAIYAGLGVPELWIYKAGRIQVYRLGASGYRRAAKSRLLPGLDLRLVARYAIEPNQTRAVKAFRARVRG